MIGYVKGMVTEKGEDFILLESRDIGYRIFLSPRHLGFFTPDEETEVKIYTYTNVREDGIMLYGFESKEELALYRKLITVSGIGPKVGLAVIALAPPNDIIHYINTENMTELTKAKGVGKKTAQRLIIDLKDTFKSTAPASEQIPIPASNETVDALLALGYSSEEAKGAVSEIPADLPVEEAIKLALKQMVNNR